jgi:hypothetical protein
VHLILLRRLTAEICCFPGRYAWHPPAFLKKGHCTGPRHRIELLKPQCFANRQSRSNHSYAPGDGFVPTNSTDNVKWLTSTPNPDPSIRNGFQSTAAPHAGCLPDKVQDSASQDQLGRRSGKCRSADPKRHISIE